MSPAASLTSVSRQLGAALLVGVLALAPGSARGQAATQMPGLDLTGDDAATAPPPKAPRRKHQAAPQPAPEPAAAPADDGSAPSDEGATPDLGTDGDAQPAPDAAAPDATPPAPAPSPAAAASPAPAAPPPAAPPAPEGPRKLALPGPAPKVVLVFEGTDPGTRDQAGQVTRELAAALSRDGRMQPVELEAPEASVAPTPNPEVAQHLKAAQDAYTGLDLDTAIKEYAEALRAQLAEPAAADPDQVAQTFLSLGSTYQLNADQPHADAAYRFALAIRPALQPDPRLYGPDIRNAFEAQRQTLQSAAAASPSTLDVDVDGPASAEVSVDGKPAGTAPVRGFKVLPGRHLVVGRAPGFHPQGAVVAVDPGASGQAHLALEETPQHKLLAGAEQRALAERNLAQPGPAVVDLARKVGAQAVIVGTLGSGVEGTRIALVEFDVAGHRRVAGISRETMVETSDFPAAMDALALELGNDWVEPPGEALAESPGGARPVYRRWYFWAGVGAAVAAGVAVGMAAASGQGGGHFSPGAGTALGLP